MLLQGKELQEDSEIIQFQLLYQYNLIHRKKQIVMNDSFLKKCTATQPN